MEIEEAVNSIFRCNCVLFLGAGYSYKTANVIGEGIPLASSLADLLDEECGEESDGDLNLAAQSYIDEKGEYQLVEFLKDTFTVANLEDFQLELGKYVWKRVYTTNYDNVYETSATQNRKRVTPVTLSNKLRDFKDKQSLVVHLNGSVSNLTTCELSAEFKLTDSSYLTSDFVNSEWITLFRNDLADADAVFFIGFSGKSDLDIKRVLVENESLKSKTFFITQEGEKKATVKRLQQFGTVSPIGRENFVHMIVRQRESYVKPIMKLERPLLSFRKVEIPSRRPELHDNDITRLFLYGEVNKDLLFYSMSDPSQYSYYVVRDRINSAFSEIINGRRHILIHSDAGNGKTLYLDGLNAKLANEGYAVYVFSKFSARLYDEIEFLCSIKDKKVALVLEDYASYSEIIDAFKTYCTDQIIILSERSVRNDLKFISLATKLSDDFYTVDLNDLTDQELDSLMSIFNHYGLWQEYSNLHEYKKKQKFIKDCGNCIRGVLLALFRSPSIKSRLSKIIKGIQSATDYYEAVVIALLDKVYSLNLDLDMLSDALGGGYVGDYAFRKNLLVNEFIDFKNQEIKVKSSILAEVLLWDILDVMSTKDVLVKMFKNFDKKRGMKSYHRALLQLQSYTSLQRVLNKNDDNYKFAMRDFFEEIRETGFCKGNPHYWLQYAICKLDEQDYNAAKIYFENAFAFAKEQKGFDSYQIKNHYARYLLENASNNVAKIGNYMDVFKEAHAIVVDPVHLRDNKYYPFRVARNYLPFYQQYKSRMNKKEKEYINNACLKVLHMIDVFYKSYPKNKWRKDVKEAQRNLSQIVSDIGS